MTATIVRKLIKTLRRDDNRIRVHKSRETFRLKDRSIGTRSGLKGGPSLHPWKSKRFSSLECGAKRKGEGEREREIDISKRIQFPALESRHR